MTELQQATAFANKILDRVSADPDDDLAVLARQFLRHTERLTLAWDDNGNRFYEPVETLAKQIYEAFSYEGPGKKPKWTPNGNALMQDKARAEARVRIRQERS